MSSEDRAWKIKEAIRKWRKTERGRASLAKAQRKRRARRALSEGRPLSPWLEQEFPELTAKPEARAGVITTFKVDGDD